MSSISGKRNGFTLVESLIALVIILVAVLIATTSSKMINDVIETLKSYFSQNRPLDSMVHAYRMVLSVGETLSKKGYGTEIPDISGLMDSTDVKVDVVPEVDVISYSGNNVLEVVTIVATYTTPSGEKRRVVKKIVRGNF